MRCIPRACLRVLHHPLWLLSPLVVLAVAYGANQERTWMGKWRFDLERYLFGPQTVWGSTYYPEAFTAEYEESFLVVVHEDDTFTVVSRDLLSPDRDSTDGSPILMGLRGETHWDARDRWLEPVYEYIEGEQVPINKNLYKLVSSPDIEVLRRSDGSIHLLHQTYTLRYTGIPQGMLFWSREIMWVHAASRPYRPIWGRSQYESYLGIEVDQEYQFDEPLVGELVVQEALRDSRGAAPTERFEELYRSVTSKRYHSDEAIDHRLLWPGALFEGASLLVLATWPYSLVAMPFVMRTRYRVRNNLCLRCAYSLEGNTDGICPECGRVICS